jgi:hypothetical protein
VVPCEYDEKSIDAEIVCDESSPTTDFSFWNWGGTCFGCFVSQA